MTRREVLQALSGIMLGMFVALLAATITSTSMPRIVAELGGSQTAYTWVLTGELLAQTITVPIWGKLSDMFSRKLLVQIALVITVLAAATAGFSQSIGMLIVCRAAQGIGAGGLMALATVLIADIVSPRERGRYMGLMGGIMAVAQVGGPLVGGLITDSFLGWRWNFFIGIPFAIAAAIVLQRNLNLPVRPRGTARIDFAGATLIMAGVSLLLIWVTFAGNSFAWLSWQTVAMVAGTLAALVAAVFVENRVADPIIPMRLFADRTFTLAIIGSISVGVAMFGCSVFLSQYLQLARERTPTESGLMTIPMVVGMLVAGVVLGRIISSTGRYKMVLIGGAIVLIIALLGMSTLSETTNFWLIGVYLFLLGISVGALMQNLVLAVQNTLDVSEMGVGTSTIAFFRTLGGAVGVSVLGAVVANIVRADLTQGLIAIGINPAVLGTEHAVPNPAALPVEVVPIVQHAYAEGISRIFLIAVPMAVIALICVLLLKEVPLGQLSGIQQMMASDNPDIAGAEAINEAEIAEA